ncbi:MAG: Coenzyme F420 hydrogenase/dehydrogenase, beta subunit C-terminal domain [Deferrisomatales bacterium]|nr:Coenzyme F420 hydrogenase/dehydrogenase, beta subunit C-terminal domain [Deferrisomatales bacterium]
MTKTEPAQRRLREQVLDTGLCTGCGACVGNCPYFEHYRDAAVVLHACDLEQGRCHAHCPRTPTDLESLRGALFDLRDLTPELGALRGLYLTRASDPAVRARAQHGGTVSALTALALKEGWIDGLVQTRGQEDQQTAGTLVTDPADLAGGTGTRFVASPAVAAFNRACRGDAQRIGVVATPCQALAYAKLRTNPAPEAQAQAGKLALVIGLFCGWALSWREFSHLLGHRVGRARVLSTDIPPSRYQRMEVRTDQGTVEIPLAEVLPCVRPNCAACFDLTCEFADLSVGSARSEQGWEVDRGWNQVITRTEQGERLLDLAREKGCLEFREVPAGNLEKLKAAAVNKKRACIRRLEELSGAPGDWLYLSPDDPVLGELGHWDVK